MEAAIEQQSMSSGPPRVGAVLTSDGVVVATGFRSADGTHAERMALSALEQKSGSLACDSTLYTTLEPCTGTTSDCSAAIIASGIKEVVIGRYDLNPDIQRAGWTALVKAGIKVRDFDSDLRQQCDDMNQKSVTEYSLKVGPTGHGRFGYQNNNAGDVLTVQFSRTDVREIALRFTPRGDDCVYAYGAYGTVVALAVGADSFDQIDDPWALTCLLYTSPSPRDQRGSRMPSSA